jgi:hypothetical protein
MGIVTISDWLMIAVVLLGPLIAVQLTRYIDNKKEVRERKMVIFKTLMATRSYTISWDHVGALNRIDLEFDKKKRNEKAVIEAWKAYLDILGEKQVSPELWSDKRLESFVDLLHKMAVVLDYDFDKTHIKNSSYAPIAHGELEDQQTAMRKGIIKVLSGESSIPMLISNLPGPANEEK